MDTEVRKNQNPDPGPAVYVSGSYDYLPKEITSHEEDTK
jgi:hypothetical protein